MTIHPDIARRIAKGMDPQIAFAQAMMETIPSHLRRQDETHAAVLSLQGIREGSRRGAAATAEKHRKFREQFAPKVLEMRQAGASKMAIAKAVGIGRDVVTRILEDARA